MAARVELLPFKTNQHNPSNSTVVYLRDIEDKRAVYTIQARQGTTLINIHSKGEITVSEWEKRFEPSCKMHHG